ncbi:MAG: hypothetical protein C4518_01040 [Desulfobacteraceae bacterium]|nr:MAG: hypothetical protein C4518_01040 [Desulfobacteraceae bacterium]
MLAADTKDETLEIFQDNEKDAIVVHVIFALICAMVLLFPLKQATGVRIMALVIIYNLMVPLWGLFRRDREWLNLWLFSFILSLLMVFPDWFLSKYLDVLVFPHDGLFKIGTVSAYMAGLWTIPVFIIVFIGERMYIRYSSKAAYAAASLASFIIFTLSDQLFRFLPAWYSQNVNMIGHVPVYIIVPKILFGLTAYFAYQYTSKLSNWYKFPAASLVMQLYLGSAVFFYFLVELKFF